MGSTSIAVGDIIGARYRIESVLGQGGMAIVYRARNTGTGKSCALKIVHPHLVTKPELVEMFVREAQVAGRIGDSPYVVNVFDAGVDQVRGVPFMAMELLKGETLDHYVETRGPMPRTMVRTLFDQLADALDQAHRSGVIHRDLKPSNLFVTQDRRGRPVLKIMDFGIAKVLEHGAQRTATRIGSPAYAAPEQQASAAFRKLAAKHGVTIAQGVSAATDVWALGLVAFELLTGLPKGHYWATLESLDDILIKVSMEEHESASSRAGEKASLLPEGFDDWFARCLRKNASERWQTPGEAVNELRRLLAPTGLEIEATQPLSDASPLLPADFLKAARRNAGDESDADESRTPVPHRVSITGSVHSAAALSDTEPDGGGARQSAGSLLPLLHVRGEPIAAITDTASKIEPESAAVQTRGTWTRTGTWPRRSKVALLVGCSAFAAVVLGFVVRSVTQAPVGDAAATMGASSTASPSPSLSMRDPSSIEGDRSRPENGELTMSIPSATPFEAGSAAPPAPPSALEPVASAKAGPKPKHRRRRTVNAVPSSPPAGGSASSVSASALDAGRPDVPDAMNGPIFE